MTLEQRDLVNQDIWMNQGIAVGRKEGREEQRKMLLQRLDLLVQSGVITHDQAEEIMAEDSSDEDNN